MKIKSGDKQLTENKDYHFDSEIGLIIFKEPLKPNKKWWQFWKKGQNIIHINYEK